MIMANEGQAITLNRRNHELFQAYLKDTRHSQRDRAIYLLTYRAGMRIGSVAKLRLDDVLDASGKVKKVVILRKEITKGKKTVSAILIILNC